MRPIHYVVFGALVLALIGAGVMMLSAPEGGKAWDDFRQAHHCQPVSASDGSNRAGWRCDDGEVHYRWRQMR